MPLLRLLKSWMEVRRRQGGIIIHSRHPRGGSIDGGKITLKGQVDELVLEHLKPVRCMVGFKDVFFDYTIQGIVGVKLGVLEDNEVLYCINEPSIPLDHEELFEAAKLIEAIVSEGHTAIPLNTKELEALSRKYGIKIDVIRSSYAEISYFIRKGLSMYGPLYPLIIDPYVEEFSVDKPGAPVAIVHRLLPIGWIKTNITLDGELLDAIIIELARRSGRDISIANPYVEAILPEGHRLTATFAREVSRFGSTLVVRKHLTKPLTLPQLVKLRFLSTLAAAYLWLLILYRPAILIIGPTASGKTTLLQSLLMLIPPYYRVVTIEDTPELNLDHHPHWDSLVTRRIYTGEGEDVDLYKLALFALRRRPDYFVIGEVRGKEARAFIHAAASGHAALTTFHADTVQTALQRLKSDPIGIGESFLKLLWSIVIVRRVYRKGVELKRLIAVEEVVPSSSGVETIPVISWDPQTDSFTPLTVEELIDKSLRLRMIMETYGLTKRDLVEELLELAKNIEDCLECSHEEFLSLLNSFYKDRTLKFLEGYRGDMHGLFSRVCY